MVSIKEFFELREAGYSVDQIKEYSSFIEAPAKDPAPDPKPAKDPAPDPKPEPKPDPVEAAAKAGSAQLPKDPTEEQLKDVNDTLKNLIGAIRGMNINQLQMPSGGERGAQEILAEIINPPGKEAKT